MKSLKVSIKSISIPLIIFLPIMLNLSEGITFNISIADVFLPFIILILISHAIKTSWEKSYNYNIKTDYSLLYVLIICVILILNLLKVSFLYDVSSIVDGVKNIIKIFINILYFGVFTYCFKVYGEEFENIFLKSWSYISVIISFLGIFGVALFTVGIENSWSYYYRAIGTFNDPNLFATYLFISISITAIYNYKNKENILGLNLFINIIAILFTSSRGAIISMAVSILFLLMILLLNREIKKVASIIKFIIVGGSLFICLYIIITKLFDVNMLENTLNRLGSMNDTIKGDSRLSQWIGAINVWKEYPILGAGIGKFIDVGIRDGFIKYEILAHNTYLTFLSELGIVGLIAFIWFPIMLLINLVKSSKESTKKQVLVFSIIAVAVSCICLNLENFRCMWVFWTYCFYSISPSNEVDLPLTVK